MGGGTKLWNLRIIARTYITLKIVATQRVAFLHLLKATENRKLCHKQYVWHLQPLHVRHPPFLRNYQRRAHFH